MNSKRRLQADAKKAETVKKPEREDVSLLSLTIVQIGLLALLAVSVRAGQPALAAVFMTVLLLAALGRIWGGLSARRLSVKLRASKNRAFPGDEIRLTCEVRNDKWLPVLWMDLVQPLAIPACMVPAAEDGSRLARKMNEEERMIFRVPEGADGLLFQQRCSLMGSWTKTDFDTVWTAVQRGIYVLEDTRIYTGDGFGLTRYRLPLESGSQKHFVIYPKIVPVQTGAFLKNLWEGETGRRGHMEDPSVMKLTRPYESTDSLKKINWRMVARGQGMTVNQYEVISPRAVHFIFDGESFRRKRGAAGAGIFTSLQLEDALSVLTSLFLRLSEADMKCGFSFPATDRLDAANLFAGEETEEEILYRMAEYRFRVPVKERSTETGEEVLRYMPSVFREEGLLTGSQPVGTYYFVTWDEKTAAASGLLKKMEDRPVKVITYEELKHLKAAQPEDAEKGEAELDGTGA